MTVTTRKSLVKDYVIAVVIPCLKVYLIHVRNNLKRKKRRKRNKLKHTKMFISELSIIVKKEKKENTNV